MKKPNPNVYLKAAKLIQKALDNNVDRLPGSMVSPHACCSMALSMGFYHISFGDIGKPLKRVNILQLSKFRETPEYKLFAELFLQDQHYEVGSWFGDTSYRNDRVIKKNQERRIQALLLAYEVAKNG